MVFNNVSPLPLIMEILETLRYNLFLLGYGIHWDWNIPWPLLMASASIIFKCLFPKSIPTTICVIHLQEPVWPSQVPTVGIGLILLYANSAFLNIWYAWLLLLELFLFHSYFPYEPKQDPDTSTSSSDWAGNWQFPYIMGL